MFFHAALGLLALWAVGLGNGFGQAVHVLLLVGLLLLLLGVARRHDAAARSQPRGSAK